MNCPVCECDNHIITDWQEIFYRGDSVDIVSHCCCENCESCFSITKTYKLGPMVNISMNVDMEIHENHFLEGKEFHDE